VPPATTGAVQSAANLDDLVPRKGGAAPAAPVTLLLREGVVLAGTLSGAGGAASGAYGAGPQECERVNNVEACIPVAVDP
jgi:hypothetical protein